MNDHRKSTLAGALRSAAADLEQLQPPAELRARVMAAAHQAALAPAHATRPTQPAQPRAAWQRIFTSTGGAAVPPRRHGWWAWSGAAACGAVLAGSALLMLRVPAPALVDEGVRLAAGDGFLPLVPPERWPRGEAAPAWLVSTELPGERLVALGLPFDPTRAGDSVRAELLLHPSGEVLAVRFLH